MNDFPLQVAYGWVFETAADAKLSWQALSTILEDSPRINWSVFNFHVPDTHPSYCVAIVGDLPAPYDLQQIEPRLATALVAARPVILPEEIVEALIQRRNERQKMLKNGEYRVINHHPDGVVIKLQKETE